MMRKQEDIENEGVGVMVMEDGKDLERNISSEGGFREPLLKSKSRVNNTSQIAIIGANVCPIESLDYDIVENDLFKQDWRSRKKVQIYQYIFLKWTLVLLIGLFTGLVGFFLNIAVENIAGFKLLLASDLMLEDNSTAGISVHLLFLQVAIWVLQLVLPSYVHVLHLQLQGQEFLKLKHI